ncbi:hypothetical protein ACI8AC_24135 [Geodermatophilus sp. SYSU D00758]
MTDLAKSDSRQAVPGLTPGQLTKLLCEILSEGPVHGMTRGDMHVPLWSRLPDAVETSWVVLRIGDEISKTLTDLEKREVLGHDAKDGLWWLASRPRPEGPTYVAETLFEV